jgi:hypothetical protein
MTSMEIISLLKILSLMEIMPLMKIMFMTSFLLASIMDALFFCPLSKFTFFVCKHYNSSASSLQRYYSKNPATCNTIVPAKQIPQFHPLSA